MGGFDFSPLFFFVLTISEFSHLSFGFSASGWVGGGRV